MSYAEHKTRVFMDAGDLPLVVPKRSEGRMRTYPSATDARAWCPYTDERRQHILDLIRADQEKCAMGKYVPIEVLIDTLLASKNVDIAKLRAQVEELEELLDKYSKLDLTEDQKKMLGNMQREIGKVGGKLEGIEKASPRSAAPTTTTTTSGSDTGESTDTAGGPKKPGSCGKPPDKSSDASKQEESSGTGKPAEKSLDAYSPQDLKEMVIQKDAEVIALKNALAARTAEYEQQRQIAKTAVEQLENLRDIMEERDSLKEQLQASFHEIETLRSRVEDPCVEEITALEQEIQRLQEKGQLTPEEEAEIIRKELQVLKKHCARLSQIKEDNNKLARELRQIRELEKIPYDGEEIIPPSDTDELKRTFITLAQKVSKLNTIMSERDRALQKIKQLEEELVKFEGLPQELENFKQKSQILDDVLDERDDLIERLKCVEGIDEELKALKQKAKRVDELEKLLAQANSSKKEGCKDLEAIKTERDMLKMKVADMATAQEEIERLRFRAKEAEVLRIERDRLKIRLDELAAIECEFMQLLDKTRCLETIKAEKEMYKNKYEELLGLECECDMLRAQLERFKQIDLEREGLKRQVRDCECCIADQEDEIKRLVGHIDRMSQGTNQQQSLTYEELQFLHTKTCDATAKLLAKRAPVAGPFSPRRLSSLQPAAMSPSQQYGASRTGVQQHSQPCIPAPPPCGMDQLTMMKTISGLENDLLKKQQLAEQKIAALQQAVKTERQRLEELKKTLDCEKRLNSELMNKIGTQSRTVANMQAEKDMLRKQSSYHEDQVKSLRAQSRSLEEDLNRERGCCKHLKNVLESERQKQRQDQDVIETMRLKLEKSLNSEMALRMQLESRSRSRRLVCPCHASEEEEQQDDQATPQQTTTTFYTELTIQDVRKKKDFVHHCSTKQDDSTPDSSPKCLNEKCRRRRSTSSQRRSRGTSESLE